MLSPDFQYVEARIFGHWASWHSLELYVRRVQKIHNAALRSEFISAFTFKFSFDANDVFSRSRVTSRSKPSTSTMMPQPRFS